MTKRQPGPALRPSTCRIGGCSSPATETELCRTHADGQVRHRRRLIAIVGDVGQFLLRETSAWKEQAACRGMDASIFFQERGNARNEAARAVCATCEVRSECLEEGMSCSHGVWGGLSVRERRMLRHKRETLTHA